MPRKLIKRTEPERADGSPEVGPRLRALRVGRNLSLDRLAAMSGVSRAMLNQIELGRSTPTIKVLWRIARAFDVPFSVLLEPEQASGTVVLRAERARRLVSHDGGFSSRPLFPSGRSVRAELYELRLQPGAEEQAEGHSAGTVENLVVAAGQLEIRIGDETSTLGPGDAILFEAERPHAYRNPGKREAVFYLVMTYADGR